MTTRIDLRKIKMAETKTVDDYLEQSFPIKCKGRNSKMEECLTEAVKVTVKVSRSCGNFISISPKCIYNTGGHGQRCKASHPKVDKVGEGVVCPYSLDIPYALDEKYKQ